MAKKKKPTKANAKKSTDTRTKKLIAYGRAKAQGKKASPPVRDKAPPADAVDRLALDSRVFVRWPGSADGTNRRRGVLRSYTKAGKPQVSMFQVDTKGNYTGGIAAGVRTFEAHEVWLVDVADARPAAVVDVPKVSIGTFPITPVMPGDDRLRPNALPMDAKPANEEQARRERDGAADDAMFEKVDPLDVAVLKIQRENSPTIDAPWPTQPNTPTAGACTRCGSFLLVSARKRNNGLCGPCARAEGFNDHVRCKKPPTVMETKKPAQWMAWCSECNTPPHTRDTRESAMAAWNHMNHQHGMTDDARSLNAMAAPYAYDMPSEGAGTIDDDAPPAVHVEVDAGVETVRGVETAIMPDTGDPNAPPATAAQAKARLDQTTKAIDLAIDKARAKDRARTERAAAAVGNTTAACALCGSALLQTKSGSQRVCARCDYFERKDGDAWVPGDTMRADNASRELRKVGYCGQKFRGNAKLIGYTDACTLESGHAGPHANTSTGINEVVTIKTIGDAKAGRAATGPQIGDDFIPPLEDDLPPDEGKMPWE